MLDTIKILLEARTDVEVRTTVIPQLAEKELIYISSELLIYVLNSYLTPVEFLPCDKDIIEKSHIHSLELLNQ